MKLNYNYVFFHFSLHDLCVGIPKEVAFDGRYLKGDFECDRRQRNARYREKMVQETEELF